MAEGKKIVPIAEAEAMMKRDEISKFVDVGGGKAEVDPLKKMDK